MSDLMTYTAGTSIIHRLPAGAKVLALAVVSITTVVIERPWLTAAALALAATATVLARLPRRLLVKQWKAYLVVVGLLGGYQWLTDGPAKAFQVAGGLAALLALAGVVSATTRTTELLELAVRCSTERVGITLALGIRSVAVVYDLARDVRAAQLARGLGFSLRAFAVPLVVRSLRQADGLAEALIARGFDD
ncbi:energy-coupling factor transporter transmembrane protein EcfT [Kribbella antibiotica]|uniref:Energy-coupling factor transporter transmembrane protein EcfT n=1 Tax=Kribbella antibiotica TaxID=190195 RepID=A0A4R4ZYZ5_9ACTN|nr:energy-coupling factor transporter transmembrane protein EcfT [Kribbella antibiotica]TDD63399.1 energy-coupling factor transporter transmembrane protein EcfT [Kribbella antibiotica]